MSLTGLKLSQINGTQEPLKDTDLFYYVTQSPGPIYDSKKGDLKLVREYVDQTVGQTLRDEFILADLNKPISTATQAALDLKVTIPAPVQHTTAGDYSNATSRRALRLTSDTDTPITIDLTTVPKNSGIVLTLTDISTNITDKLTTKTVKQLLVFKDTAGVVTEVAGTVGVSIVGQVVSVVYKGIASKVIKTLITVNVEVLSEDNAVA